MRALVKITTIESETLMLNTLLSYKPQTRREVRLLEDMLSHGIEGKAQLCVTVFNKHST